MIMKTIGIIAEYNPFHNGHAYQISEIRKKTGADFIVAAMSGDFVQRGAPAVIDKFTRTRMALSCGADLVIELPVLWSVSSAECFAMAGVTLFDKAGCIDGLCFGAESGHIAVLKEIADILADEPKDYRNMLSAAQKEGSTFPAARAKALSLYLSGNTFPSHDKEHGGMEELLASPNNILAIEYLKALKRRNSDIRPFLMKREGAGYHSKTIVPGDFSEDKGSAAAPAPPAASATAIRMLFGPNGSLDEPVPKLPLLKSAMPPAACSLLLSYLDTYPALCADDFTELLGLRLLSSDKNMLGQTSDVTPDIADRLYKNRCLCQSYSGFCGHIKTRNVTYTRISRILLHLILNLTKAEERLAKSMDYIPYLRILGFKKSAAPLLAELEQKAAVPVIKRLPEAATNLPEAAYALLEKDIFAGELYRQIRAAKTVRQLRPLSLDQPGSELSQPLVLL